MNCGEKSDIRRYGKRVRSLGGGSYGDVNLYENNGTKVAIKTIREHKLLENANVPYRAEIDLEYGPDSSFLREASTMRKLDHRNVINVIDIIPDINKGEYHIVIPVGKFDLHTLIAKHYYNPKEIARGIAEGLNYLANQSIITGDLKPSNIVIFEEYGKCVPKIIDFGFARIGSCAMDRFVMEPLYSFPYRPHEILNNFTETVKSDAWVFGVILYELNYKEFLFRVLENDEKKLLKAMISKLGVPDPDEYPGFYFNDDLKDIKLPTVYNQQNMFEDYHIKTEETLLLEDLILKLLRYDPEKRYSISEALNHPYFNVSTPQSRSCLEIIRSFKLPPSIIHPGIIDKRREIFKSIPKELIEDRYMGLAVQLFDRVINCQKIREKYDLSDVGNACLLLAINYISYYQDISMYDITTVIIPDLFEDILVALDCDLYFATYSDFIEIFADNNIIVERANEIALDLTLSEDLDAEEIAVKAIELASQELSK